MLYIVKGKIKEPKWQHTWEALLNEYLLKGKKKKNKLPKQEAYVCTFLYVKYKIESSSFYAER